jgi:hypothetical protein
MRLFLVFVLLLDPSIETRMAILAVLPFVTLFAGLFLGAAIGRDGIAYQFRRHIDKHFFQVGPAPGCSFCKMERGVR